MPTSSRAARPVGARACCTASEPQGAPRIIIIGLDGTTGAPIKIAPTIASEWRALYAAATPRLDPSVNTGRPVSDRTCSATRTDASAHSDIVHWPRGRVVVERP